jgi:hypothetical protein
MLVLWVMYACSKGDAGEELGVVWEMAGRQVGDVWEILSGNRL